MTHIRLSGHALNRVRAIERDLREAQQREHCLRVRLECELRIAAVRETGIDPLDRNIFMRLRDGGMVEFIDESGKPVDLLQAGARSTERGEENGDNH